MPRKRSESRDKALLIWRERKGKIQLKDIAEILGVSEQQVRKWKCQDKWDMDMDKVMLPNKANSNVTKQKNKINKSQTINQEVDQVLSNTEINDKQKLFCLHYAKCFNATKAYQKAYGCSYETAGTNGYELLQNTAIRNEIFRLKQNRLNREMLTEDDIVQKYMDIAFADMSNYVRISNGAIIFNDTSNVDGSMIRKVSTGKVDSLELYDSMKALDWLHKFFLMNPMDKHKIEYDKKKAELELYKLEMSMRDISGADDKPQDNFIDVLNESAEKAWDEYVE